MNHKFDAIVVGAGPAGCSCALVLARAGLATLLVERGKFPGAKNMWGGALYGPSLARLYPRFWEEAPVERFILRRKLSFLTEESSFSTEFAAKKFGREPYQGFSVLRAKFDRWLASRAEQAGAVLAAPLQAEDLLWEAGKVAGIRAGGDDLPADVVIACDGVNSLLAEKAGLRKKISPKDVKLGVKEVIQLPREAIEKRFNLSGEEGIAWECIGSFTRKIPGGAFIYTNKESLSVGLVVGLSELADRQLEANELLEGFKAHPEVSRYLEGGKLAEYSAHLIPASGQSMMPKLLAPGFLVAGDAAAMTLVTGLILEGANFAIVSGMAAAETVIAAKRNNDFSKKSLTLYPEILKRDFVLKDLKTFRNARKSLKNPRLYWHYPRFVCEAAEKIYTNDGQPRKKAWKIFKDSMDKKVSRLELFQDLIRLKRSI